MRTKKSDLCDFHAHILPGADHGSSSCDNSIRQLIMAEECGVSRIVATPHFYPQRKSVADFLKRRDAAYSSILPFVPKGMNIALGAEVLLCENMENLPDLEKLCIGKSNVILLELPYTDLGETFLGTANAIMDKGITIILAHAERYEYSYVNEFVSFGAKIQLNATSLTGFFGIDKNIMNWLDSGAVVALGSDIHGADKRAYKSFLRSQKKISKYIQYIKDSSDEMWSSFVSERASCALT